MPFFSVLIPSYNRPELIGAAVDSVLANDFDDFELIVSDDKSPRQTEIAQVLQPRLRDRRVSLHLQPKNLREAANREFLFHQAKAEWLIVLCDDDKLYPNALSTLAKSISEFPNAEIYTFGYTVIDQFDTIAYSRRAPKPLRISVANSRLTHELLISDAFPFWLYHPATFCSHRNVRNRIKPNSNIGIGDDLMYLIDFVNAGGGLQVVPQKLMYYRKMTENSVIQMNQSAGEMPNLITRTKILQHLKARRDLHPQIAALVSSKTFGARLLYDQVLWAGVSPKELSQHVEIPKIYLDELKGYLAKRPRILYRPWLFLRRVFFFISTFGVAGLHEVSQVAFSRVKLRTS